MTQATIYSIECTLYYTSRRESISPTPSVCYIEVFGNAVNINPSYTIDAAADVINVSPHHTHLHHNLPTGIVNAVLIDVSDDVVNANPSYTNDASGDIINTSSSHTYLPNNPPINIVNISLGGDMADETEDMVNLALANTIVNLHEISRVLNLYLVKYNVCNLGILELVEINCVALACIIQLFSKTYDIQEHMENIEVSILQGR